jgi:hypothetical protein
MNDAPTTLNRWLPLLWPIVATAVFALAHTQSPLYYSNQNQYFLKGLANAGVGDLRADWLANTTDPVPVFSTYVTVGQYLGGGWVYQATFFAALMLYYLGLRAFLRAANEAQRERAVPDRWNESLFLFLLVLTHSAASRLASDRFIGTDYPWFLHAGLANQYILGPGLQPSVVGVGLLWSLVAFVRGRVMLAVMLASGVNLVHSTYLLPSALLVFGILVQLWRSGSSWKQIFTVAGVSLAVVAPVLVYNFTQFGRADGSNFAEAQRLLADERLAHHTRPARWFDSAGAFQLVWLFFSWLLLLRTKLATVATVALGIALVLSILAIVTGSPTLALMFPWRLSAVFVPVSTAVVLGFAVQRLMLQRWSLIFAGLAAVLAAVSVALVQTGHGYAEPTVEDSTLEYIRTQAKPGDLYVIPAKLGKPTTARGVYSNTFMKPLDPTKPVYFEFARFRLYTRAALYIDFKSIPYRSDEVMEWHRRLVQCEGWFADNKWAERNVIAELRQAGVTHVVAPKSLRLSDNDLTLLHDGGAYEVFELSR